MTKWRGGGGGCGCAAGTTLCAICWELTALQTWMMNKGSLFNVSWDVTTFTLP
jgi:hypothetical protein